MMQLPRPDSKIATRFRQLGAASVAIAMLMMFILVAAVIAIQNMSGSSVIDSTKSEEQVAALFLAESGVERAQAVVTKAASAGTMTNTTCEGLNGSFSLGRGNFVYSSATSLPPACGGANPAACSSCAVTVTGNIVVSSNIVASRVIRTAITTTPTEGAEGCGDNFTLAMPVAGTGAVNAAAFTHLAYRPKRATSGCSVTDPNANNALVGSCINTGGTCDVGTAIANDSGWDISPTGTNAVASMGVYAGALNAGDYTIQTFLVAQSDGSAAKRNYVQTGLLFYPDASGSATFKGSFYDNTTYSANGDTGSFPTKWTCQLNNAATTADMRRAASANALIYGFSSWPLDTPLKFVDAVWLGLPTLASQPMRQLTALTGQQGDNIYSQIWMSHNASYDSSTGTTPVATNNVVTFTGTLGANFKGKTVTNATNPNCPSGTCLELTDAVGTNEILNTGDIITNNLQSSTFGTLGAYQGGSAAGTSGSVYAYSGSVISPAAQLKAQSVVLHIVTAIAFVPGQEIRNSAETISYGTPTPGSYIANSSTTLTDGVPAYLPSATNNLIATGNIITATGSTVEPVPGTAIAVWSGSGKFSGTVFTGSITSAGILTLEAPLTAGDKLCPGDALFGTGYRDSAAGLDYGVLPKTTITTTPTGGCTSAGPFTVAVGGTATQQTVTNAIMVARAAVKTVTNATSYTVSRPPKARLSGANLCGGVCAMLFDTTGMLQTNFYLNNKDSDDDWASGFACFSGVDPFKVKTLGKKVAKRGSWAEIVQ